MLDRFLLFFLGSSICDNMSKCYRKRGDKETFLLQSNSKWYFNIFEHSIECPKCSAGFERCLLVRKTEEFLILCCSPCGEKFEVSNFIQSRDQLTVGSRNYNEEAKVSCLEDIGKCDLISYKVSEGKMDRPIFGICKDVNYESKVITIVKLIGTLVDENLKVVEKTVSEEKLLKFEASVYRYLPLDCSTMDETLSGAEDAVEKTHDWLCAEFGDSLSPERFANWLKTGNAEPLILRVQGK